jgi:arylsulfatase A-like enzyme
MKVNFCILLFIGLPIYQSFSSQSGNDKYNILFIIIDDLRPDLGAYENYIVKSPNIDKLARQGIIFNNMYAQIAICAPSRDSMLTSRYIDEFGIYDVKGGTFRDALPDIISLPQLFKNSGYYTSNIGKIFHFEDEKSWNSSICSRDNSPTKYRDYYLEENILRAKVNSKNKSSFFERTDVDDTIYFDGWVAQRTLDEIVKLKTFNTPFFLAIGFTKPHLPFNVPLKYWDLYETEKIDLPQIQRPQMFAPSFASTSSSELFDYPSIPSTINDSLTLFLRHGYYASISYVDEQIGKILDALKSSDLFKKTIIVIWGDHGYKLGEYGEWAKHSNREFDTRVPCIMYHPAMINAGQINYDILESIDIYPTLCELSGIKPPESIRGVSFGPLFYGQSLSWNKPALSQYRRPNKGDPLMGYTIRTEHFRYTKWELMRSGELVAEELYSHLLDPLESYNLCGIRDYVDIAEQHRKLLKMKRTYIPIYNYQILENDVMPYIQLYYDQKKNQISFNIPDYYNTNELKFLLYDNSGKIILECKPNEDLIVNNTAGILIYNVYYQGILIQNGKLIL